MAIWCFEEHVLWGRTAQNVQTALSLVSDNAASPVGGGGSESPRWQAWWWFKCENIRAVGLWMLIGLLMRKTVEAFQDIAFISSICLSLDHPLHKRQIPYPQLSQNTTL